MEAFLKTYGLKWTGSKVEGKIYYNLGKFD
jgi:hypothetical protein